MEPVLIAETARLRFRRLSDADAPFVVELLNDADFIQFIGDKHVRTEDEARAYLRDGPIASYARHGFGLFLVTLAASGEPIGFSGLLKRDHLDHPDLGYAFVPAHRRRGYAVEAGRAVIDYGRRAFGLTRVLAITQADNGGSIRVLESLGFSREGTVRAPGDEHELLRFGRTL